MTLFHSALVACFVAASAPVAIGGQVDRPDALPPPQVFTVDGNGAGDFVDLATAIAAVPSRSLLVVRPGVYAGAVLDHKSLRIESELPQAAQLTSPLVVQNIGPNQEVHLGGLFFHEGFLLESSVGEIHVADCEAIEDGLDGLFPPEPWYPCGRGLSRHMIRSCEAVSLVDCRLRGRHGFIYLGEADGTPGEHAVEILDSTVAIYGGVLRGGDGGNTGDSFFWLGGSGGDAVHADGLLTSVRLVEVLLVGGIGGRNISDQGQPSCHGVPVRTEAGAVATNTIQSELTLAIQPLAQPGSPVTYSIDAPIGADLFLMVGTRRTWRDFPVEEGILHIDSPFQTIFLGTSTGTLTGTLPAVSPAWRHGFVGLELQVQSISSNVFRFSEPRSLVVAELP